MFIGVLSHKGNPPLGGWCGQYSSTGENQTDLEVNS